MRTRRGVLLTALAVATASVLLVTMPATPAAAFRRYLKNIPNAARVPCPPGVNCFGSPLCQAVGHTNCLTGGLTTFGRVFGRKLFGHWNAEFCASDSDGDGYSNGDELGDECCIFQAGLGVPPERREEITNPGNRRSMPVGRRSCSLQGTPLAVDGVALAAAPADATDTATAAVRVSWQAPAVNASCACSFRVRVLNHSDGAELVEYPFVSRTAVELLVCGLAPGATVRAELWARNLAGEASAAGVSAPITLAAGTATPGTVAPGVAACVSRAVYASPRAPAGTLARFESVHLKYWNVLAVGLAVIGALLVATLTHLARAFPTRTLARFAQKRTAPLDSATEMADLDGAASGLAETASAKSASIAAPASTSTVNLNNASSANARGAAPSLALRLAWFFRLPLSRGALTFDFTRTPLHGVLAALWIAAVAYTMAWSYQINVAGDGGVDEQKQLHFIWGARAVAGRIIGNGALTAMAFVLLPVTRHSIWISLAGLSYDRATILHRRLGEFYLILMLVHGIVITVQYHYSVFGTDFVVRFIGEDFFPLAGLIAGILFGIMWLLSWEPVRRRSWSVFKSAHYLALPATVLTILHVKQYALPLLLPGLLLYVLDQLLIVFDAARRPTTIVHAQRFGDVCRLTLRKPGFSFDRGQFVMLWVPHISLFSHPISISSLVGPPRALRATRLREGPVFGIGAGDAEATTFTLDIKSTGKPGSFSARLLETCDPTGAAGALELHRVPPTTLARFLPTVIVAGAFGIPFVDSGAYDAGALLLGAGIGVTPLVAQMQALLTERPHAAPSRELRLAWCTRDVAYAREVATLLAPLVARARAAGTVRECSALLQLTSGGAGAKQPDAEANACDLASWRERGLGDAALGRIDVRAEIVAFRDRALAAAEAAGRPVSAERPLVLAVVTSGPLSFMYDVAVHSFALSDARVRIDVSREAFAL